MLFITLTAGIHLPAATTGAFGLPHLAGTQWHYET